MEKENSDNDSRAANTSEKKHDSNKDDQDKKSKADSAGTDLAKGPTDEKPKTEATPTRQGAQGSFVDRSKMIKFVQISVPSNN